MMGNPAAMLHLGFHYQEADQPEQAFRWYKAGHEAGYSEASHHYALCLHAGYGTEQDQEAFPIFRSLADRGDGVAAFFTGHYCKNGIGTPQDYHGARRYFRRGADEDNGPCWNGLGALYVQGLGVERDVRKALDCFLRAGKLGCSTGYTNAGWLYESDAFGTGADMKEALRLYKMAADQGDQAVVRQLHWIEDHSNGKYWPENIQHGIHIIEGELPDTLELPEDP